MPKYVWSLTQGSSLILSFASPLRSHYLYILPERQIAEEIYDSQNFNKDLVYLSRKLFI